ncbi:MAG: LPS export ABC transporter permease LptG [Gammaproteobacteria bacterium]|nr:LPS export ABC transporter permease LptG [Gammaproteobacteria bacterium]
MISLIDRHIGLSVATGVFAVLMLLLVLMGFFELLAELDDVERGYTTMKAFTYVALVLPRYAYELFPVATLLGSLIGLGALASHSELTAMRAAGISISRIMLAVLKAGLVLLALVVLVGELLAPRTEQHAQRMKMDSLAERVTLKTRYGFWSRNGNSYINVRQILADARLADISIYEYNDAHELQRSMHAAFASYQADGRWLLEQVQRSEFGAQHITVSATERLEWQTLLEPTVLDVIRVKPHMLPAWDLWRYIRFLRQNGQESATYAVAFWNKLMAPLVTLVMLFLSIPFVFGPLRSVGIGQRIFTGAIIGIVFYLLNKSLSYMAVVYGIPPFLATALPAMLFFAGGIWFLRRVH